MAKIKEIEETELESQIEEYLKFADDLQTGSELKELIKEEKRDVLSKLMMNRLIFGTAGIRGRMGPGYGAMNDLVVIQTSQGIAEYLDSTIEDGDRNKGVVIGFDNRHNSERFAHLVAVSFLLKKFKVYLFSAMVPTAFVPYSIVRLKCLLGIMVTASHNSKEYNGVKLYWSNGAQILPEYAENIQESIFKNLEPWPGSKDASLVNSSPLIFDPFDDIVKMYIDEMKANLFLSDGPQTDWKSLKIVITSLHGVSHDFLVRCFQTLNFKNFFPVKEQMQPDPDFPTVEVPNPEEDKTFQEALSTAEENDCQLIFALDPDADRFRMAEAMNGRWRIFTGNEIAALLGFYRWKTKPQDNIKPSQYCMISSVVSSKILRSMSAKEGFRFYDTLTGFKWIANMADDCTKSGMKFLFGFEEAIGFMCGPMVMDKDGILTAMHILTMAHQVYDDGNRLSDLLNELYMKYGFHYSHNSYFICSNHDTIKSMFHELRNFGGIPEKYPDKLEDGKDSYEVLRVRDVTTGYDSLWTDKKCILPLSPSSEMITFFFENMEVTIRSSGTEPKLKYYSEILKKAPQEEWQSLKTKLIKVVKIVTKCWIRPKENGFEYPQVTD